MSGSLVLLPLRLGLRVTGLAVRGAREIVERAAGLAGLAPDRAQSTDFDAAPSEAPIQTDPPPRPTQTQTAGAPPLNQSEAIDYDAPEEKEPVHIHEGSELVRRWPTRGARTEPAPRCEWPSRGTAIAACGPPK